VNKRNELSRRQFLIAANLGVAGLSLASYPLKTLGQSRSETNSDGVYFPPPENQGGWRSYDAKSLPDINTEKLAEAIRFHDQSPVSTSRGAALIIIHKGRLIGESYVTGKEGGPKNWTA
jgi:hypothetical protein